MPYKKNILEAIGNTPLVKINNNKTSANLFAKAEYFNPMGSVKDRAALYMIKDALATGKVPAGGTLVEPTSGNTGIGLAYIGNMLGLKVILTMPDTLSIERRQILASLGAELVLTEGAKGMKGAVEKAKELLASTPNSYMPNQFENPANVQAHYETTGPELWKDLDGNLDILIAGVGTGGTISGAGKYLKEKNPAVKVIAVEPAASAVLSGNPPAPHKIQGIGAGFVPGIFNRSIVDEILTITNEEAVEYSKKLQKDEGLYAGISSGAAFAAAIKVALRTENAGKNIVFILPDTASRYLSVL